MNITSLFLISFLIALSGALAPGPLLAVVIAETPREGFKTGPLIITGHAILEILMVSILLLGFSKYIHNPTVVKNTVLLGTAVLIYSGFKLIITTPSLQLKTKKKSYKHLAILGVTMSLANPYWTIWWLTIGLGLLLTAQKMGLIAILFFFLGHILADFTWYSLVSLAVSKGRKFISIRIYKIILTTCGMGLIFFSIYFFFHIYY